MAKVEVTMPKMGESITEGTVLEWHKQPGDRVEADEPLLEIGTDKVDTEVPSPASGILKEIRVPEGETVEVGTVIAVIETEVEEGAEEATPTPPTEAPATSSEAPASQAAPAAEAPAPAAPAPSPAPSATGAEVEVVMPKMGESITEGTVLEWHKQPGDRVEADEPLLEIGTDKVDTEVPSPASGILKEIRVPEGETVEVGTVIAVIATEAGAGTASQPSAPAPATEKPAPAAVAAGGDGAEAPAPASAPPAEAVAEGPIPREHGGRFFSPLVRSIAEKEGLSVQELASIPGSGREGRLTKQDVLAYLENRKRQPEAPAPAPAPARPAAPRPAPVVAPTESGRVEIIEMDRMRQIIAEHMVRSKATSAHVTSFAEADVTNLVRLRERNKEAFFKREGVKLTFTPFFVKAAVEALREHPLLNASVEGNKIIIKHDYHIGIAVAIGKTGLLAPVIRNAGHLNIAGLARAAADLAARARSKQLQPDELQGGTFTVTNIGSLGSLMGTPIINQPQVAILATGAIKKRPVVVEDPDLGDIIAVRHMMYLSLSYDHRIIDGAMGASFLQKVVSVIESFDPNMDL
ncbi:MAG: dihydrolipoamide acetyltransferase component of pyruvate dehydrogenase complex [Rhodothermaceae bacterium]|nr:MAG: dihydrolipoamide acetyltransferase component of pyruvate dehydrogenase complex [Rhodothermaceae bacterium]